ncbi:RNA-binding protein [Fictibacillus terranigra]|uniref:RNA-binding protein n=1 Tax=Fictibacillus terranigra TaxID=3058424 RepID=A0ABT8E6J0_9BACL|nr:RNA-binding protein [Fictibacillus sp. CENA-BCM004]MDN4073518.1 RNA-binding protein [Fictibacillus sp. CENA-BCM004]
MNIYQHFRKEEYPFIDQVLQWKSEAEERYSVKLTDFLDPREQDIAGSMIGKGSEASLSFWGGSSFSERKRALIYPSYFQPEKTDFEITVLEVNYPTKFVTIEHRDVLGSLMNLGMKRGKFGDILHSQDRMQIIVAGDVSDFVRLNLERIGKAAVRLKEVSEHDLILSEEAYEEKEGTVSSLRLDVVLSEIYRLSRSKISPLITGSKAKVNWRITEEASFLVEPGDYLSLRGYGRSKLIAVEGKTKKDRWRIRYGILQ